MAAPNPYINRAIDAARGGAEGWQQEAVQRTRKMLRSRTGAERILSVDPEYRSVRVEARCGNVVPRG